jgi:hypothetical protein
MSVEKQLHVTTPDGEESGGVGNPRALFQYAQEKLAQGNRVQVVTIESGPAPEYPHMIPAGVTPPGYQELERRDLTLEDTEL